MSGSQLCQRYIFHLSIEQYNKVYFPFCIVRTQYKLFLANKSPKTTYPKSPIQKSAPNTAAAAAAAAHSPPNSNPAAQAHKRKYPHCTRCGSGGRLTACIGSRNDVARALRKAQDSMAARIQCATAAEAKKRARLCGPSVAGPISLAARRRRNANA